MHVGKKGGTINIPLVSGDPLDLPEYVKPQVQLAPPSQVHIIGSFDHNVAVQPEAVVDLAVVVPDVSYSFFYISL